MNRLERWESRTFRDIREIVADLHAQIRELKQESESWAQNCCQECYDEQSRRNWEEAEE